MANPGKDTVVEVAKRLQYDVDKLLELIAAAGLPQNSGTDVFTNDDMRTLKDYMSANPTQPTLTRTTLGVARNQPAGEKSNAPPSGTLRTGGTLSISRKANSTVKVATVKRRRLVKPTMGQAADTEKTSDTAKTKKQKPTTPVDDTETKHLDVADTATAKTTDESTQSQLELEKQRIHSDEEKRQLGEDQVRRDKEKRDEDTRKRQEAEDKKRTLKAERKAKKEEAKEAAKKESERLRREAVEAVVAAEAEVISAEKPGAKRSREEKTKGFQKGTLKGHSIVSGRRKGGAGRGQGSLGVRRRKRTPALDVEKHGGEFSRPVEKIIHDVEVGDGVTVGELARRMSVKAGEVIKTLMTMGELVTINETLDQDTAVLVVEEMGHRVKLVSSDPMEEELELAQTKEGVEEPRPPVVTVMGHVDHGKTSLLDYIRETHVVNEEHGGITQHIGAYHVVTEEGAFTFLDTPGHALFSSMRARGANATDIVVLVCAADDGVMPQTQEAVQHAQAAKVPIIVAINKMDKEGADSESVKTELSNIGVTPDDWGGDSPFVQVSAKTGDGIKDLLSAIALVSELSELTAVNEGPASGIVIESKLDRGKGPVASLLVQNGKLQKGDIILAGECFGKVRSLVTDQGSVVSSAQPSMPVEILGLNGVPVAGDKFNVTHDEKRARQLAVSRASKQQKRINSLQQSKRLENMFAGLGKGEKRILKIIVKTDVRGTLEAITQACSEIGNDEVAVQILGSSVGGITESDANLALTYDAMIFGFNVRLDNSAKKVVEKHDISVRYYNIVYELLEDVKKILEEMLVPDVREEIVGTAEVRDVFHSPRFGQIAGCRVVEGTVFRNKKIRVLRDSTVIYEGELESLRRFKDDVNEVKNGLECGIGVRNYNDVREGDRIEVFDAREIARAL
ncbi:MAG: translation initiation factor IF-2 [Gammaproteobacteria bacterium]|nr:translation initiation factor IF-2 [Gammaproteobacteria bacterium]MDE0251482.1 translation initiation factor IF-2 [Gammaproteobacteria bacterium]MDE0401835.1 translation initiation factor IF-2 [Gammaproteobacteria bacterium]